MAKGAITVKIDGQYDNKDIDKAIRDLNRLKDDAAGTGGSMDGLKKGFAAAGIAAAAAAAAFVAVSVQAVKAAMEEEAELAKLNQTLDNLGFGNASAQVNQFLDDLQYTTTFTDSEMRPAFAKLAVATKDVGKAQGAMATALDLATYSGVSAEKAAQALAKAFSGNTKSLKTMVPGLDAAIIKSGDMNAIMAELSRVVGGQASAAAGTLSGKLKILGNAGSELQEAFGTGIMQGFFDAVSGGTDDLAVATDALRRNQATVEAWGKTIGNIVGNAIGWLDDFGLGAMKVADTFADAMSLMNRAGINTYDALNILSDEEAELQRRALDAADASREQAMRNYALKTATEAATTATTGMTAATGDGTDAAEDAKAAADALKGAIDGLMGGLSRYETVHNFKKALHDLDEELKGNARSFKGWSDAAEENRTTIIDAFQSAQGVVSEWANRTNASADEVQGKFATLGAQIVDKFVAQGFKKSDIKAFLKDAGLWNSTLRDALNGIDVTSEAYRKGQATGGAMADGFVAGLQAGARAMANQAHTTVTIANQAAKNAAGIASPSKVWAEMGGNLTEGLAQGIAEKAYTAINAATDLMKNISQQAGQAVIAGWDKLIADSKTKLDEAVAQFDDFKSRITSSLTGQLDLSGAIATAKQTGGSVVDAFTTQAAGITSFAQNLIDLTKTNLSQSAWEAVAALNAENGKYLTDQMLGAQGQAIIDGINKVYGDVETMANAVGDMAAQKWYGKGVEQAQKTYEGFRDNFGPGGPARVALENLMDRLARSLDRTSTITIKTVYEAAGLAGKRAAGGPVSAGQAYLVGEQGPEVLVMGPQSGTIIPNGALGSSGGGGSIGGGNSYNITVQAGVGDPRQIGQQIVEYIKKFESANGPAFAAA